MRRTSFAVALGAALLSSALLVTMRCGATGTAPTIETDRTASAQPQRPLPRRASPLAVVPGEQREVSAPERPESTPIRADSPPASKEPPREVVVYVTDEGGAPISSVLTYIDADSSGVRRHVVTDAVGRARFIAASGLRRIDIMEKMAPGRSFLPVGVIVVGATDTEARVRLREGAAIEGRVLDERDAPVVRVNVTVLGPDGFHNEITTGDGGEFRLPVPVGSTCDLRLGVQTSYAFHPDEDHEGASGGVAAGTTGVLLRCRRVPKDRTLSVMVMDPTGAPRPGVYVGIALVVHVNGRMTDADGRCRFVDLPGRELTATAWTLGGAPNDALAPSLPAKVVPDGQEIVLQLRRANLVEVALEDAAGVPVAVRDINVVAQIGTRMVAWARSDAAGRLTLKVPVEDVGVLRLVASPGDGTRLGEADVVIPADREVRIVIERK